MGKKREHMTIEQIKEFVAEEIPYVVGQGNKCIQARAARMKELMRRHGHDISLHVGVMPVSFAGGASGGTISGSGSSSGGSRDDADGSFHVGHKHFRGQRVA
jgi:hypothetical protein